MKSILALLDRPRFIFWCFAAYVVLRIVVLAVPLQNFSDGGWYLARGIDIASGLGYSERGIPTAFWPVGYPAFLGLVFTLFGKSQLVAQLANLVLQGLTFFLVLALSRSLFRSERVARAALLLLTIYPNHIAYTALTWSEVLFTTLVLLAAYAYLRREIWPWFVLSGLTFGVAALVKPQILFFPAVLCVFGWLPRLERRGIFPLLGRGVAIYALMAVVLVPWAVRNTLVFGEMVLISTNGGFTLLYGNNPAADGRDIEGASNPLAAQARFSVQDQVAADKRARALAVGWIKEHPSRFLMLMPLKALHLWLLDGDAEWSYQAGFPAYDRYVLLFRAFRVANQIYYCLLLTGGAIGIFMLWRRRVHAVHPDCWLGLALAAYTTAISMVFSGQIRFHFPVMPWIIMFVGVTVVWLVERQYGLSRR